MKGKLYVIGIGPGSIEHITKKAENCIMECDVLAGYTVYIEQIEELCRGKEIIKRGMGQEIERCRLAIESALQGKTVGLVCSGDSGLYGMAGLVYELLNTMNKNEDVKVEVIPGITSALSCSSLLGAPIVEDFCTISLSDYMISWDEIMKRVEKAAEANFTIALYNPRSMARPDYLKSVIDKICQYRASDTPVGIVRNAYRQDQSVIITALGEISIEAIDMFCTVIIGNSRTKVIGGNMVTSRGYKL